MAGRIAYYGGVVSNGLVLALDAAKKDSYPGSGTVWRDISGNGNNGTLTNGPTFNSNNGGSIVFDGVDDYVISNTPSILNLSQPTTLNIWFYFNSFSPINPRLIECRDSSNSIQLIRDASTNKIATKNSNFESGNSGIAWVTITTGVWYNISVVWVPSLTTTILYLNGISQSGSAFSNIATGNQNNKIVLGARSDFQSSTWMNGRISNLQIYNRALSATEVLQNYNATKGRYGL
jgi:hypothetical protein